MADVLIVCVREDEAQAKTLADMFEAAGFTVGGAPSNDAALRSSGAGIVVWSQASIRSRPFLDAAQRVINAGKGVLACLIEPPPPESVNDSAAFDLTRWAGDSNDPSLDPLFFAVDRMVNSARASVGAAPAEPAPYEPPASLRPPAEESPYPRSRQRPEPSLPPAYQARPTSARASNFDGSANDPLGSEAEHWRAIRHSKDPTAFLDYLARYGPEGAFAELAEFRLKQLEGAPTNLRSAARAVEPPRGFEAPPAARRPEPPRYDAPPPRQQPRAYEPPPRRAEPPPRAYEPPQRRPEAPPPPRRREANFDHRSPVDAPPEAPRGGGLLRLLVLLVLLGGGAIAAGIYFGVGDQLQAMTAPGAAHQTAQTEEPASAPVTESGSAGVSDIPDAQVLDTVGPSGVVSMSQAAQHNRPAQVAANNPRRAPPAPTRQQQAQEDGPTPAPSTSWTASSASNSASSGGPASLLPGASGPSVIVPLSVPQQYASNTPAPNVSTSTSVGASQAMVRWTARPSPQRMTALYPSNAIRQNIGGSAQLDCIVRADLGVSCSVASEGPANAGFGRAALASVSSYRASPTLSDGSSSIGARTRIAITFRPPAR